jgi:hypothetical protein
METKYKQQRDAEYAALGIDEPSVLSTAKPKNKRRVEPIYISTKKPRTVGPNDHGNNWPGNISRSKKAHKEGKSLFTDKLGEEICERMCNGEAPSVVCKDPRMPNYSTVLRWTLSDDPKYEAFRIMFEEARKIMWLYHADQMLQIADDSTNDYVDRYNKFTEETERVFDNENSQRSKLRIDTRKWLLSKMLPHVYGDKVDVSVGGRDGKPIALAAITMSAEDAERAYMDMISGNISPKQLKKD